MVKSFGRKKKDRTGRMAVRKGQPIDLKSMYGT